MTRQQQTGQCLLTRRTSNVYRLKSSPRAPVTEKKDNHSVVAAIRDLFATFGKVKNRSDGNLVVFNRSDAGKMMFNSGADMRMLAPHLKDLFIDAPLAFSNPPHDKGKHPDVVAYKHYINKFTDTDGKDKYIRFTVREHKGGENRHGVHAATVSEVAIYESENAIATGPANNARGSNRVFLDNIISKFLAKSQGESFKFSRPIERRKDLIAVHNMDAEGLAGADKLGGLEKPIQINPPIR